MLVLRCNGTNAEFVTNICSCFCRNATKFVNTGFIKLRGFLENNEVMLAVEDSGIGIPVEKQDLLFAKFQESLDQLSQGTVRTSSCALLSHFFYCSRNLIL